MTVYSVPLRAHLARDVTTLCHCWRVTRADGAVLGFTDHDLPLTVDGTLFKPQSGLAASEARQSLGLGVDTVDVEGALSSEAIDADDVRAGKFDGAAVETLLVNWATPTQFARLRKSRIAKITHSDGRFVAELQSAMRALDRPNGRHIARTCDAELGDGRCRINLDAPAYSGVGEVTAVNLPDAIVVSGLGGFAAGWFSGGRLSWLTGSWTGETVVVRRHERAGGADRLVLQTDGALGVAGDTFRIVAGCDKAFATCKAKFSNVANFRGFPHLPGNDDAYGYVTEDGEFDGGALVE